VIEQYRTAMSDDILDVCCFKAAAFITAASFVFITNEDDDYDCNNNNNNNNNRFTALCPGLPG